MKLPVPFLTAFITMLFLTACDTKKSEPAKTLSPGEEAVRNQDIPVLPVKTGDTWTYEVKLEIPSDVTSEGAAAVSTSHRRTRTYLGKISAAEGLPETDCFEVTVPGAPSEREFVEIHEDRILMRGSLIMRPETTKPMWLETPVPFIIAGMKPGTSLPEVKTRDGALSRKTQIIAREEITVPAGKFPCIRILTTGNDGEIEMRRTVWFAPGKGIIREEKTRYRREKLLYRESQELAALKKAP
jgi:hypothetical protein